MKGPSKEFKVATTYEMHLNPQPPPTNVSQDKSWTRRPFPNPQSRLI